MVSARCCISRIKHDSIRRNALPRVSDIVDSPRPVWCVWIRWAVLEEASLLWRCVSARDTKLEYVVNDAAVFMGKSDCGRHIVWATRLQAAGSIVKTRQQVRRRGIATNAGTAVVTWQRGSVPCNSCQRQQNAQRPC